MNDIEVLVLYDNGKEEAIFVDSVSDDRITSMMNTIKACYKEECGGVLQLPHKASGTVNFVNLAKTSNIFIRVIKIEED